MSYRTFALAIAILTSHARCHMVFPYPAPPADLQIDAVSKGGDAASEGIDAATDAGTDDTRVNPEGTLPPFCSTRTSAAFCEDFDHPDGPRTWEKIFDRIEYDSVAMSPPTAAHIVLPPDETDNCRYMRFNKEHYTASRTTVRLEWAFWLGGKDKNPGFERGSIVQLIASGMPGTETCVLFFRPRIDGTSIIKEQDKLFDNNGFHPDINTDIPASIKGEQYYRGKLEMTLGDDPRYTFSLDGDPLLIDEPMMSVCAGEATKFETNMGFHCQGGSTTSLEIRLDDIAVTFP